MSTLNPKHPDCNCENEAETLYNMWNIMDLLKDNTVTGKSSCCTDEDVTITVKDKTVTIVYLDGTSVMYPPITTSTITTGAGNQGMYALTAAQFEAPTIGTITPTAAAGALISANATTGFATNINVTSNASGVLTFYYRLTSSSEFGGSVTFGDFTLGGNNQTQDYTSTWLVSNGTPDVTGNYSGPTSITTYELNTVKTSTAATITALQSNFTYTLSAASGLISANAGSGFASTISITSDANSSITFYYQLTSSQTSGQAVSMGTLTLSAGSTNRTYTPNWSVTTKAVDMAGSLSFNPTSKTNATTSTIYTTTITYSGLEPNYTFKISNSSIDIGAAAGNTSSPYTFTTDGNGSHTFWGGAISSSSYGGVVSAGTWTLTDPRTQLTTTIAANWSVTTGSAKIDGTISTPTNITGATTSQSYTAEVSLTNFAPSVTFTISHSGTTGRIGTSSSSFATSINVPTDGNGSATIWYRSIASSSYSTGVAMPDLTITGGGSNRSYTPTWTVTTSADPATGSFSSPTNVSGGAFNTYYSASSVFTGMANANFRLDIASGSISLDNATWVTSVNFTTNSSGTATIWFRVLSPNSYSSSASPATLTLTHVATGSKQTFNSTYTVATKGAPAFSSLNIVWTTDPGYVASGVRNTYYYKTYGGTQCNATGYSLTASLSNGSTTYGSLYDISGDNVNWGKTAQVYVALNGTFTLYARGLSNNGPANQYTHKIGAITMKITDNLYPTVSTFYSPNFFINTA